MLTFIIFLLIVVSILLVLVVLAQDSKGGIGAQSSATQLMGVKRTGDLLERLTWGFSIAIMVLCVSTGFVIGGDEQDIPTSTNIQKANEAPRPTQAPAPAPAPAPAESTPAPAGDAPAEQPAAEPAK